MTMTGNTIFITGATSGIGRGLAEAFYARGNRVIITGRRQDRLDAITAEHPGMRGFALDVRDTDAIKALADRLAGEEPGLNVLINNAGISRQEKLTPGEADLETTRDIIETNIMSVVNATAAFLPLIVGKPHAAVLTTTSGLAFVPISPHTALRKRSCTRGFSRCVSNWNRPASRCWNCRRPTSRAN